MDEIQTARYDRVFDAYIDPDGYMTFDSLAAHIYTLADQRSVPHDSPATEALLTDLQGYWQMLAAAADTDNDGRVSREEWRTFGAGITDLVRQVHTAGGEFPLNTWIRALFGMIDADGDGRITRDEYANWLAVLHLADDTDVDGAFAGFDKDDDGSLSWEEFAEASRQFWSEFDPSLPGHRWIGP